MLSYVNLFPGFTSAELAQKLAEVSDGDAGMWTAYRPMLGRRLPELEPVNLRKGTVRRCAVTGMDCLTWWPR